MAFILYKFFCVCIARSNVVQFQTNAQHAALLMHMDGPPTNLVPWPKHAMQGLTAR